MDTKDPQKRLEQFPPVSTAAWEEKILADLKGADYQKKLIWQTGEGFTVKPYYRAEDLEGLHYIATLPGSPPYVRGLQTGNNHWIIRQDIESMELDQINPLAVDAIARGADSIGIKANNITSHQELSDLLKGIDPEKSGIQFISAKSYPLVLEFLVYELNHRGIGGDRIAGSVNFDPLSYLLLHGNFYISWENDLEEAEYILGIVRQKLPGFKAITINGHYFQDAGSTLVQELGFSVAAASEYLAGLTGRGASIDDIAPFFQLSLAIGPSYFLELAKFRAARLLWSRLVEAYGAKKQESARIFLHATTANWNKSIYDPYVNMLRTTTESMSAALGNADSITVGPFDASFRSSDDFSRRVARNQQLVLKEEAYLDKIADPAGGSYLIEALTDSIARHAWDTFKTVEARGGFLECVRNGSIQDEVAMSRKKKEEDIATRRMVMLGTNQYPNLSENMADAIGEKPAGPDDPTPIYKQMQPFRVAAGFEELRLSTEKAVKSGRKRPSVFLLTIGNLAMLRARAGFATNFFGCAGYEIIDNPGFSTAVEGISAALKAQSEIVVVCSSDEEYPAVVPEIAASIKVSSPQVKVVVAGYPKEHLDDFRKAGVDDFIHVRSNLLETLKKFQSELL
ncbi:MAG TPA: methylmalonyl-CoA mutase family protein [Bacteroidales bacterium]|nr:methylmalonyl-CoA mutase family protein [Bacteroidales bacterium]